MTVITCGRTNLSERAEAITRVLREQQGFRTDGGCGRAIDLDSEIQHMQIVRCAECLRWLCRPCIIAHFAESRHDTTASEEAYRPSLLAPSTTDQDDESPDRG